MLLAIVIAFFPSNVQIQAFDGTLWTGFDTGSAHVEVDTTGAVAVWTGHDGEPAYMNAAYSLIMKD